MDPIYTAVDSLRDLRSDMAYLNHNNFVGTASKYGFDNYMVNVKFAVLAELL